MNTPPLPDGFQVLSREEILANPDMANAFSDAALKLSGASEVPEVPDAPDDLVILPGGLVQGGTLMKRAVVRELTGADEEALSRALRSQDARHFIDTLISRGTVSVGGHPVTPEILGSLYIGDRNELAVAIRAATYGEDFAFDSWVCPHCGGETDISFPLSSLDRVTLDDPMNARIEVPLRKGGKATVRFPTGDDEAAFSNPDWTRSEQNSEMLRRCVISVTDAKGVTTRVMEQPSLVSRMSIPDRAAIVKAIVEKQPGPRFTEVEFVHDECQKRVTLALGVGDMFRELVFVL